MYRVTLYNGSAATIIHEPSVATSDPHLYTCSLVQGSSGEIDTLSFDILPNNPGYELLASRTTMVTVYNTATGKNEFSGRVLTITPQMDSSGLIYKSVVCEDRLGFLCDSIQPYTAEATYALEDFFKLLLENHNSQVEDYKKIYPGTISATASASTGNVTKGLNYETTWEALNSKLLDTEGGEIQLYEGTDGLLYLDYVDELGSISDTTIELGKNMTSISKEIDSTDIITRLIPLGANLEADEDDDSDVDTNARTTIASVNNGTIWLDDEEAQAVYGIVVGTVEWEDVTEPSNLLTKGNAWLASQTLTDKVTLTALDLSIIGLEPEAIERYNYYRTINAAIGLDAYLRIVKRTVNICDPSDITFEMGERNSSLTATLTGASNTAGAAAADAVAAINGQLSKTVTALIVSNATIVQLQSTLAEIETAYITTADVETLLAGYAYITTADVESLLADYASITMLDAATGSITNLSAEIANINSLLAGNIGAGTVQTIHLSADNTVIDEALIETIYAANGIISDLVAGTIYTDSVQIANNDGQNLWIDGATIQINDGTHVRVQIGEDASGDYNLYLWNADGVLIWDALGLTEAGLTGNGAIIKDAAVADDAAISGYKLDITSVASCLNEDGSLVVDAANVTINDSTLAAEYVTITTAADEAQATADEAAALAASVETRTTTLETELEVVQGQITAKVWQTDITEAISGISIGGRNYLLNTRALTNSTGETVWTTSYWTLTEDDDGYGVLTLQATSGTYYNVIFLSATDATDNPMAGQTLTFGVDLCADSYPTLDGLRFGIFGSNDGTSWTRTGYSTINYPDWDNYSDFVTGEWVRAVVMFECPDTWSGSVDFTTYAYYRYAVQMMVSDAASAGTISYRKPKLELGTIATDWTPAPEDTETTITTIQDQYAEVTQTISGITTEIGDLTTTVGENYSTLESKITAIEETAEGITASVSDLSTTVDDYYTTLSSSIATLETTANSITASVSAVESQIANLSIGGRNYLPNTRTMDGWSKSSNVTLAEDDEGYTVATWAATSALGYNSIQSRDPIQFSLLRGQTVALSFDIRSDDFDSSDTSSTNRITVSFALCTADSTTRTLYKDAVVTRSYITDEWTRYTLTATLSDDYFVSGSGDIDDTTRFFVAIYDYSLASLQVRKIKLEIGTIATDWTPAPEDTETEISTAVSASLVLSIQTDSDGNPYGAITANAQYIALSGNVVTINSDYFTLAKDGSIVCTAGTLGGWTIGAKQILSINTLSAWSGGDVDGDEDSDSTTDDEVVLDDGTLTTTVSDGTLSGTINLLNTDLTTTGSAFLLVAATAKDGVASVSDATAYILHDGRAKFSGITSTGQIISNRMIRSERTTSPARVGVKNNNRYGYLVSSASGNLGIYDNTNNSYVIYSDTSGSVHIPHTFIPQRYIDFAGSTSGVCQVRAYYNDGALHAALSRASDGLTTYLGWDGSGDDGSTYASVTIMRGRTVRYQNSSGTTTLSDERLKKDWTGLDRYDDFFDRLEPKAYKYIDGNSGRYHIGAGAQTTEQALLDAGLTTQDFAGLVKYPAREDEEGNGYHGYDEEYGLIYTEFVGLLIDQVQKLKARVSELESKFEED